MIQIPADLVKLYTSFMEQKGLETDTSIDIILNGCVIILIFVITTDSSVKTKRAFLPFLKNLKKKSRLKV